MLLFHLLIELVRASLGYGQGLPVLAPDHFPDVYDLPYVMRIVGQLPIDRIDGQQGLMTDIDGAQQIVCRQAAEGIQEAGPALFPLLYQLLTAVMFLQGEFSFAIAAGFFSILGEEVRPPADHITAHVFYDDGDTVGLIVRCVIKILFFQLTERIISQELVACSSFDGALEVGAA